MSPVSRGRKRKNTKDSSANRSARQRSLIDVASEPAPACDCPVCRGEDFGPAQLIDALLSDATALLEAPDPLDAEIAGAVVASTVALATGPLGDEPADQLLLEGLLPAFEAHASAEAMTMLLALGAVAPDPVATAASAAADRLARAGVTRPEWADEVSAPITVAECWRLSDPARTGSILGASFARAGHCHAMLVCIDALDCGAATDIALLDGDELPAALAILRSTRPDHIGPSREPGEVGQEALDPAEWRWQVENALDARAVHDDTDAFDTDGFIDGFIDEFDTDDSEDQDDDPPSYPALAVLLRARLATLPASSKPKPAHGGHDEDLTIDITSLAQTLEHLLSGTTGRGRTQHSPRKPAVTLPTKRGKRARPAPTYQIKVGVRGAHPPIWRRLELPADISLAALHDTIQIAFDWDDYHMHLFHTPYGEFGAADPELGHRGEAPVTLEQVAPTEGDKISYTYDFGDNWNLDIIVEKVLTNHPSTGQPRCTGGRRAAPPEDSGGIWAYTNFIQALADPDNEDALDGLGYTNPYPDFDPTHFDADTITEALSRPR